MDKVDAILLRAVAFLKKSHREHHYCEGDSWYNCPRSPDGCCNPAIGPDCNCGTDAYNAELDEILDELAEVATPAPAVNRKERHER